MGSEMCIRDRPIRWHALVVGIVEQERVLLGQVVCQALTAQQVQHMLHAGCGGRHAVQVPTACLDGQCQHLDGRRRKVVQQDPVQMKHNVLRYKAKFGELAQVNNEMALQLPIRFAKRLLLPQLLVQMLDHRLRQDWPVRLQRRDQPRICLLYTSDAADE